MVRTRSELKHLSKNELSDELVSIGDISSKVANLTARFYHFSRSFEFLSSELAVSKNCNRLLSEWIIQSEGNAVNSVNSIEVSPVPISISDEKLEDNSCKALSLTGHQVIPDYLQACHRLKKMRLWLWHLNLWNKNKKFLLTGKISAINLKILVN